MQSLDSVVNVRLTREEKASLQEDADMAGISVSALVRRRVLGHAVIARSDDVMLREMRRLGGLLKHVHNESGGAYSEQTARALAAIEDYFHKVSQQAGGRNDLPKN
jgi:hypothetical protein